MLISVLPSSLSPKNVVDKENYLEVHEIGRNIVINCSNLQMQFSEVRIVNLFFLLLSQHGQTKISLGVQFEI